MADPNDRCPEGWEPAEIMAYLDKDMSPAEVRKLEEHLPTCSFCSEEIKILRQMDTLLKMHPESFHPAKQELYRLAVEGAEGDSEVRQHVRTCPDCTEEFELLIEMISRGRATDVQERDMPSALVREFERVHGSGGDEHVNVFVTWWRKLMHPPSTFPFLTLGTVTAILIVAIVATPVWRNGGEIPFPGRSAPTQVPASEPAEMPDGHLEGVTGGRQYLDQTGHEMRKQEAYALKDTGKKENSSKEQGELPVQPSNADERMRAGAAALQSSKEIAAPAAQRAVSVPEPKNKFASPRDETSLNGKSHDRSPATAAGASEADDRFPRKKTDEQKQRKAAMSRTDQTKLPVEVRIVDPQGRDFRGVSFSGPPDANYFFYRGTTDLDRKNAPGESLETRYGRGERHWMIVVKVTCRGADFDLEGSLFSGDSTTPEKTDKREKVGTNDLEKGVEGMVVALMNRQ